MYQQQRSYLMTGINLTTCFADEKHPLTWNLLNPLRSSSSFTPTKNDLGFSKTIHNIAMQQNKTITTPSDIEHVHRELKGILHECSKPDWDGYDAAPVDRNSVQHVLRFLHELPEDISYPELTPEPKGELAMEWNRNGYHIAVGISANGHIAWGGTGPNSRIYGDATYDSCIPKELLNILKSADGNL